MKLENQVCTLEQSKTLKELGVIQASVWFWEKMREPVHESCAPQRLQISHDVGHPMSSGVVECSFSAFSVAELGLAFRDCISGTAKGNRFYATPDEYAGYDIDSVITDEPLPDPLPCYVERDTQAQALADLLIWLLKTGLLKVDEVNERLNKA